ncbi:MAG: PorT family protein [Flavobacteriales bacterium]|jgi:hypothetical protein|nr:MAG: PorT family protein [Flavobacteriales bacterium]
MRRSTLFLALTLPLFLNAADAPRNGPRLGVGMATITAGGLLNWNGLPKVGPLGGWAWEIPWTEQASWLIEPMYITKGSLTQNAQQKTWTSVRLGYIEVPVAVKFSLRPDPGGIFLTGSILGGYWINGRQVIRQDGRVLSDQKYNLTYAERRSQASVGVGLGWDMGTSAFEIRVQQSISPFSTVVRGQNMVAGLHYTYYLPKKTTRKEKEQG